MLQACLGGLSAREQLQKTARDDADVKHLKKDGARKKMYTCQPEYKKGHDRENFWLL